MKMAKIVNTDNFGGDYPNETFLSLPRMQKENAVAICALINDALSGPSCPRFWKVVDDDYVLEPGFEP